MILPAQMILARQPLSPLLPRTEHLGFTHGLSAAGYDVRIAEAIVLFPGDFALASTVEIFDMPDDLLGIVHDKSSWARRGLAVQNTVIEPGWRGHLTLELTAHRGDLDVPAGVGIAQVVFHLLAEPTDRPYRGKYQDQAAGPQEAR